MENLIKETPPTPGSSVIEPGCEMQQVRVQKTCPCGLRTVSASADTVEEAEAIADKKLKLENVI